MFNAVLVSDLEMVQYGVGRAVASAVRCACEVLEPCFWVRARASKQVIAADPYLLKTYSAHSTATLLCVLCIYNLYF